LKTELLYRHRFLSWEAARTAVFDYIEGFVRLDEACRIRCRTNLMQRKVWNGSRRLSRVLWCALPIKASATEVCT
jgi:hypothetical protein